MTDGIELSVDRLETGCIGIELLMGDQIFYIEIGQTKYSAYFQDAPPSPTIYFEGKIDDE